MIAPSPLPHSLPFSEDAEAGTLSCFLQAPELLDAAVKADLTTDAFYHPAHRLLYETLLDFREHGRPIDIITLSNHFIDQGKIESIGGAARISELFSFIQTPLNYDYYQCILQDKHRQRQLIWLCERGLREARNSSHYSSSSNTASPTELEELIAEINQGLTSIQHQYQQSRSGQGITSTFNFTPFDQARITSLAELPAEPQAIISMNSVPVCHRGDLTTISGQAKGGKSAFIGAILGSLFAADMTDADDDTALHEMPDCLGCTATPSQGKAILFFDTEMNQVDSARLARTAARRAGLTNLPENFRHFRLRDFSVHQCRQFIFAELQRAHHECSGIHAVAIDGVADLIPDVNHIEDAVTLVRELMAAASRYTCPIICALHENPAAKSKWATQNKTRGHLGSELERKSESNISLSKDDDEVTEVFSTKMRHAPLKRGLLCFKWNSLEGMHTRYYKDAVSDKRKKLATDLKPEIDAIFEGITGGLSFKEFTERAIHRAGLSRTTFIRRRKTYIEAGLVKQSGSEYLRQ